MLTGHRDQPPSLLASLFSSGMFQKYSTIIMIKMNSNSSAQELQRSVQKEGFFLKIC